MSDFLGGIIGETYLRYVLYTNVLYPIFLDIPTQKLDTLYGHFFQKLNEKFHLQYYNTSGRQVFVCFLEEVKTPKSPSEIN